MMLRNMVSGNDGRENDKILAEKVNKEDRIQILKSNIKRFFREEDGIGVVEIILILVVLIGLIIIFKSQLTTLVTNTFSNITNRAGTL